MAKKTNKTSHVLNLITGSQPPVASSGETQPSSSASGETQQEGSAAEEPVRVPSANVTVVDPREEGKLAEEIQKNLIQELEKEQTEEQAEQPGEQEEQPEEQRPEDVPYYILNSRNMLCLVHPRRIPKMTFLHRMGYKEHRRCN